MKSEKIRIVIADDHKMMRETWKLLLEHNKSFVIIAECSNGAEAIEATIKHNPDIVLMDINMSPVNGFEATRKIMKQLPTAKIIGMSLNNQPGYVRNMLQLGAKGYVTKNSTRQEMEKAITEVAKGGEYICEEIREKLKK